MAIVLVVNDDRTMLDVYEAVLRDLGHEPITKMTASSGPDTVRDVGADALLVDLERPDEEEYGLRIIEELRERSRAGGAAGDLVHGRARPAERVRALVPSNGFRITGTPNRSRCGGSSAALGAPPETRNDGPRRARASIRNLAIAAGIGAAVMADSHVARMEGTSTGHPVQ
jgi:CheY-like chemotaxis protein